MFLRYLGDCIMCLCFDTFPVFVLSFGGSLKENRSTHEPLLNVSLLKICVEGMGVDEGKQLLLLLLP